MNCAVCDKQRKELHRKTSAILPSTKYLICNECLTAGLEPRWIVALAARSNVEAARKHIVNKLYLGPEIVLREVMG
jgi:hypothetical protein